MWCHDGKISLAGFISGIITTIFTSQIVLTVFSLDLTTLQNVLVCFAGPIGTYALFCVITYFVSNENDFAVFNFEQFCMRIYHIVVLDDSACNKNVSCVFSDNKKSNSSGRLLWTIDYSHVSCTRSLETVWCVLFLHGTFSLQWILNDIIC